MSKRLLLVDDDPSVRSVLMRALGAEGYELSFACDGEEAMAAVARAAPDLMILDVNMPKLDGHNVCARLRRDAATRTLPILMLSMKGECSDKVAGLGAGADDYLAKPFDLPELKARVCRLLERSRVYRSVDPPARLRRAAWSDASVFLFTDLHGSTALYERLGDATAFSLVEAHFALLNREAALRGGVLVKTMGDAIMAVFPSARQAILAAVAMQRAVRELLGSVGNLSEVQLKVGIHEGAAIARHDGGGSDYFGNAVNVAARLCGQCRGGDIVLTDSLMSAQGVPETVDACGVPAQPFTASLKGLSGTASLWRLSVAPGAVQVS